MSAAEPALNGDLSRLVRVDTASLKWAPSPSGSVWRKRLHRVGPAESGQVTSVVRYEPGSTFPAHDHPDGEEILVLEGVFSDEHGDWPAGTYLLNPEGFRHAPFSREGCVLFVKLRQFGGAREHVVIDTLSAPWQTREPGAADDIEALPLYADPAFPETMCLERWARGAGPVTREWTGGAELFVLDGALEDAHGRHGPRTWLRLPDGARQTLRSDEGCRVYVKAGGVSVLQSG